jgi:RNA polymerase sigma factor (sigma-70 family)
MFGVATIDDGLVERATGGSYEDLSRLAGLLQPQIRMMVVARLSPTPAQLDLVDDIVQEIAMGLVGNIANLRTPTVDGLRAFLSGIAANQVAQHLRELGHQKPQGRPVRSLDSTFAGGSDAGPLWEFLSFSGTSPISAADRADRTARLLSELGKLEDDDREVITLAFFDQLTPGEIGRRIGLTRNAASMLLLRAVRTLRHRVTTGTQPEEACGTPA